MVDRRTRRGALVAGAAATAACAAIAILWPSIPIAATSSLVMFTGGAMAVDLALGG